MKKKLALLIVCLILILSSCAGKRAETLVESSMEAEERTAEPVPVTESAESVEVPIPFMMDVLYVTKDAKGKMDNGYEIHPYISFGWVDQWHMGQDPMTDYSPGGKFVQEGDRIIAMRQQGVNAPVNKDLFIELQIMSETELKVVKVADEFYSVLGSSWEWLSEGDILIYQNEEISSTEESTAAAVLKPPKQFVGTWIGVSNSRAKIDINADGTAAINGRAATVIFVRNDVNGRIIKLVSKNKTLAFEYKLQGGNAMTSIGDDGDLAFYRQGTAHPIEQFVGKWITDSEKPPEWGEPIKEFTIAPNLEIQINNGETIQLEFNYLNLISKDSKVMDCVISKDGNTLRFQLMGAGYAYYRRVPQE